MGAPFFWRLWHSMQAMLSSFLAFAKFGTRKGILRYGICVPCSKRLPTVRDAFSEALRAQNRLLGYGMNCWDTGALRNYLAEGTANDAEGPRAFRTTSQSVAWIFNPTRSTPAASCWIREPDTGVSISRYPAYLTCSRIISSHRLWPCRCRFSRCIRRQGGMQGCARWW